MTNSGNQLSRDAVLAKVKPVMIIGGPDLRVSNGYAIKDELKVRGYEFEAATSDWVFAVSPSTKPLGFAEMIWAYEFGIEMVSPRHIVPSVERLRALVEAG